MSKMEQVKMIVCCVFVIFLSFIPVFCDETIEMTEPYDTVEFVVKPGGELGEFTHQLRKLDCTFTYVCQGGTSETWELSVYIDKGNTRSFSCAVRRPSGTSYLHFEKFSLSFGANAGIDVMSSEVIGHNKPLFEDVEYTIDDENSQIVSSEKFQNKLESARITIAPPIKTGGKSKRRPAEGEDMRRKKDDKSGGEEDKPGRGPGGKSHKKEDL